MTDDRIHWLRDHQRPDLRPTENLLDVLQKTLAVWLPHHGYKILLKKYLKYLNISKQFLSECVVPIKLKAVPENIRVWDFLFFGCAVYIYSKHWEHTKQCKKYFFTYLFHRVTKTTFDPPLLSTNKSKQTIFNVGPNYWIAGHFAEMSHKTQLHCLSW